MPAPRINVCIFHNWTATTLRIKRHSGHIARGGFLVNITYAYRIKKKVTSLTLGDTTYLQAHAFPNSDLFIVPNFMHRPNMICDEVDNDSFYKDAPDCLEESLV